MFEVKRLDNGEVLGIFKTQEEADAFDVTVKGSTVTTEIADDEE